MEGKIEGKPEREIMSTTKQTHDIIKKYAKENDKTVLRVVDDALSLMLSIEEANSMGSSHGHRPRIIVVTPNNTVEVEVKHLSFFK